MAIIEAPTIPHLIGATVSETLTGSSRGVNLALPKPYVLGIGDSILAGCASLLRPFGWSIDAVAGRNVTVGIERLRMHVEIWQPERIYFGCGTNGGMTENQFQQILELMDGSWKAFATVKVPRQWRLRTNKMLRLHARTGEINLHDWAWRSAHHPEWFWPDRTHPRSPEGTQAYVQGARKAVYIEELDSC